MTLQTNPDSSHVYIPPVGAPGQDIFSLARPPQVAAPYGTAPAASRHRGPFPVDNKLYPGLYYGWIELYDGTGPIRQRGKIDRDHAAKASSTLYTGFPEHGIHPFLTVEQATPDPSTATASLGAFIISSVNVFNQIAIAVYGLAAGPALESILLTETGATNPALSQRTYAKGDAIVNLANITLIGVNYLASSFVNTAVHLVSDLASTPTAVGSMHANTAASASIVQTELPGRPLGIKAGTVMYTLAGTAAFGDAPTSVMTNVPQGGYVMGLQSLGGGPVRVLWNWPRRTGTFIYPGASTSATALVTSYEGSIVSTNQGMTDPQTIKLPIDNVLWSFNIRDGFVACDMDRLIFHNGRFIKDLEIFRDFPANSNRQYKAVGGYRKGSDLSLIHI